MNKIIGIINITFLIIISIISLAGLFGFNVVWLEILAFIIIVYFFIDKIIRKIPFSEIGLDIKLIGNNLKNKRIYFWLLLPVFMCFIEIIIANIFIPEYIPHLLSRVEKVVSLDNFNILLIFQLIIFALWEEVLWRAFFQNKLSKYIPIFPAILITSALFAIGHISGGINYITLYDILFVFINSIIYGIVFYKSKNAWMSFFSHFLANITGLIILFPIIFSIK